MARKSRARDLMGGYVVTVERSRERDGDIGQPENVELLG